MTFISDVGDWSCSANGGASANIVVLSKPDNLMVSIRTSLSIARPFLLPFEEFQKTNYKSANIIEGERLYLRCTVMEGYGLKARLDWYKYNESEHDNPNKILQKISDEDGHIHLNDSNPIDQTLTIDKVVPSDRSYYVCLSTNGPFTFNNTILLRVKGKYWFCYLSSNLFVSDKLGALWPFLGIVTEVVILCTIIFIYEKRRIKPDFDDSDNDNNTDP